MNGFKDRDHRKPFVRDCLLRHAPDTRNVFAVLWIFDVAAARSHKGVVDVMTSQHKPELAIDPDIKTNPFVFRMEVLQSDEVRYANQPIAVVIDAVQEWRHVSGPADAFDERTIALRAARQGAEEAHAAKVRQDEASLATGFVAAGEGAALGVDDEAARERGGREEHHGGAFISSLIGDRRSMGLPRAGE